MIDIEGRCVQETTDSNIKFEENGKKIVFRNPQRKSCLKIQVDGCVITQGVRCDNLLKIGGISDTGSEFYIELKGTDIVHAAEQLSKTISSLHNDESEVSAYIICSNVKPAVRTSIQIQKVKFKNALNAKLIVKESGYQEIL